MWPSEEVIFISITTILQNLFETPYWNGLQKLLVIIRNIYFFVDYRMFPQTPHHQNVSAMRTELSYSVLNSHCL